MNSETEKAQEERNAFLRFAERIGERTSWVSVESRQPREPDLICVHEERGSIAFELVRVTDSNIAKVLAVGPKIGEEVFSTEDPTRKIIKNKLKKKYETEHPIELLVYSEGEIITPDDVIIPTIIPLLDAAPHPFRRVWFMGEKEVGCLWESS